MKCEKARELFSDYCEGALQPAMNLTLETHLSECGLCRTELDDLSKVWEMLDAAPIIEPPANFRELVWEKIDAEGKRAAESRVVRPVFSIQSLITRRALAWTGAAVLILVLAPFVVPGKFSAAGFDKLFGIGGGQVEKTWTVSAQAATINPDDRNTILLPITIDSPGAVRVAFRIESGPATVLRNESHAIIRSGETHILALHLLPESPGKLIVLQADWDQNGKPKSQVFKINAP